MVEKELEENKNEVKEPAEAETRTAENTNVDNGSNANPQGVVGNQVIETDADEDEAENVIPKNTEAEEVGTETVGAENPVPEVNPDDVPKFTQAQLNEFIGKARQEGRDSAMKSLLEHYGVNSNDEMDQIFGNGQNYDMLNEEYNGLNSKYNDLSAENALLKTKILEDKWFDVKAILSAKGLPVTAENILAESATHPEWLVHSGAEMGGAVADNVITPENASEYERLANKSPLPETEPVKVYSIGSNVSKPEDAVDHEKEKAFKDLFGDI